MRKIKFRGKSIEKDTWVFGSLVCCKDFTYIQYTQHSGYGDVVQVCSSCVDPETVGQFTGLFDKKSVEIYESDVVFTGDCSYIVRWSTYGAWLPFALDDGLTETLPVNPFRCEIIGNIYDKR